MRRIGYAEREYAEVMRRKKAERRRQATTLAIGLAIFGGLVAWVCIELYMWANGLIG
jgi:hypothetical protein